MKAIKIRLIHILTVLTLCGVSAVFLPVHAEEPETDGLQRFQKNIDRILNHSCLRKNNYGIKIFSLDRRQTVYALNSDTLFTPASNLKLITTAVAVKRLGPNYRFYTRLFSTGRIKEDTLQGDLYIKGFGDPKFVTEQMWLLANELRNLPLRRVEGDLIADDTYFDSTLRVKTWKAKPGAEAYNAPLGALSFNFNTVAIYVSPGKGPGSKPIVVVDPDVRFIKVKNRARTVPRTRRSRLIVNRVDRGDHNEITIDGVISESNPRQKYFLNITDPSQYALDVFKEYLARAGVTVSGKLRKAPIPDDAYVLVSHRSEPLALALRGLNKFSNNFVAEQIIKTLGAELHGQPGTTDKGLQAVREYMTALGFSPEQYRIVDGSGLSRQNRLSPDQIVAVLADMSSDLSVYPEFVSALGVMGVDGNVKERLNGYEEAQRVRVKTGTLNFVSALSGYFQSEEGERFAFSILMNDLKCPNSRALKIQDRIVREGLLFRRVPGDDTTVQVGMADH